MTETDFVSKIKNASQNISAFWFKGFPLKASFSMSI
jgi:hypothetical protein